MHCLYMSKYIVKLNDHKSVFRVVIPRELIRKLHWEKGMYIAVEDFPPHGVLLWRVFDDKTDKGQNR